MEVYENDSSFKRPFSRLARRNSCCGILTSSRINLPFSLYDLKLTNGLPLPPMQEIGGGNDALFALDLL
ncbi:hypothetical protein Leryth_014722 [Lithospermum erythrorhizon]|nr:hypothetical protein Leryth_014722 [Lithospermum erythrorhizon]